MLIMSEEKCRALGLTPRARFVNFGLAGDNPQLMLTAPIPATQKALQELASEQRDDVLQVMATELVQMRAPRQPKPAAAE